MRDENVRLEELAERHLEGSPELGGNPEVQRYAYVTLGSRATPSDYFTEPASKPWTK